MFPKIWVRTTDVLRQGRDNPTAKKKKPALAPKKKTFPILGPLFKLQEFRRKKTYPNQTSKMSKVSKIFKNFLFKAHTK